MDAAAIAAASGLRSRMEALDMLANNLANTTTAGYKGDREFYSLFSGASSQKLPGVSANTLPVIQTQWTDQQQGSLETTGNPLDVAISGKGFFAVNGPSGPLYTRNGSFQISATGVLTTSEGHAVRATGGSPITVNQTGAVTITSDGRVQQGGQTLGQLELVDFQDTTLLDKQGNSYFRLKKEVDPVPASGSVEQGRLEASNVVAAESAVRLVDLMRQYEMLQKAISITSDMDKQATEQVAKVNV